MRGGNENRHNRHVVACGETFRRPPQPASLLCEQRHRPLTRRAQSSSQTHAARRSAHTCIRLQICVAHNAHANAAQSICSREHFDPQPQCRYASDTAGGDSAEPLPPNTHYRQWAACSPQRRILLRETPCRNGFQSSNSSSTLDSNPPNPGTVDPAGSGSGYPGGYEAPDYPA